MAEMLEESQGLESTTVNVYRTSATVKGGRRFSFAALVVVGDRRGSLGIGYAKAPGVPAAIEKAQKAARKQLFKINLQEGTLPHPVNASFGASSVRLLPASPGTGISAGGTVRAVLELAGIRDCLTKAYGSTNKKNLCKATMEGLKMLRTRQQIAAMRGIEITSTTVEEQLELGRKYAPQIQTGPRVAKGPQNIRDKEARGSGKGGRGGRGGRGGGGGGGDRGGRGQGSGQGNVAPAAPAAPAEGAAGA
jgi:small subunit ribosomal protein S5